MTIASPISRDPSARRPAQRCHEALPHDPRDDGEISQLLRLVSRDELTPARKLAQRILGGASPCSHRDAGLAGALTTLGVIACDEARMGDAINFLRAAAQRGATEPHAAPRRFALLTLARVLGAVGEMKAAEAITMKVAAGLTGDDDGQWATALAAVSARNCLAAGSLDDADTWARTATGSSGAAGLQCFERWAHLTLAAVALLRDDVQAARRMTSGATQWRHDFDDASLLWLQGRICEASDGPSAASELVAPLCGAGHAARRLSVEEPGCAPWLVRLAMEAGDRRDAATIVESMRVLAISNPTFSSISAAAKHAHGLLTADVALLAAAASEHVHPWNRASAAEDAGLALIARGDTSAARAQFEGAVQTYARIGARRDAARIQKRLRGTDRRRRTRRGDAPTLGWDGLTETERRVAELVADGLTNRQVAAQMFLSRHTVDFHLRQAFRKLDVHSRVQLTRLTLKRVPATPA